MSYKVTDFKAIKTLLAGSLLQDNNGDNDNIRVCVRVCDKFTPNGQFKTHD